jgi:hypothetical protein
MHKFAALALLLAAAMFVTVGDAAALGGGNGGSGGGGSSVSVHYEGIGPIGVLTIVGAAPGTPYAVFDSVGLLVANGVILLPETSFPVVNSGPSSDGTILTADVGGEIHAVIDPNWEWD